MNNKKKKIAILASGWAIDYVRKIILGAKSAGEKVNADIYIFSCYQFIDQLQNTNLTSYNIFSLIDYKKFDGVIILSNIINSQILKKEIVRIKESGIPAVSLLQNIDGIKSIQSDEGAAFYTLLQHTLDEHHCKDYAYIGGPNDTSESINRLQIFKNFIKNNNLTLKENRVFTNGDYSIEFAKEKTLELIKDKNNLPQIIVCVNDVSALTSMAVAKENGINIPEQIKIIGFDNERLSGQAIPSLSTCDAQTELLGSTAVFTVLNLQKEVKYIPSIPIIRQSCGCCPEYIPDQLNLFISKHFSENEFVKFNSHVHHLEDSFLFTNESSGIITELNNFFEKRHYFEGSNFSIQLQKRYFDAFLISDTSYKSGKYIDDEVISIVQIVNDKQKAPVTFKSKEIIPPSLRDEKPCYYYILPLVYLDSLIGYCTFKNSNKMLIKKRGYNWMRNFCNQFETFKQKTSFKLLSEKYLSLSTSDALSGTLNRLGFNTIANNLFENNKKQNNSSVIIFIDINFLKKINDKYGHLQGDFAIKTIADTILKELPVNWVTARYGGDEFVVVGKGTEKESLNFCNKFQDKLNKSAKSIKLPYEISVSLGSKVFTPDYEGTLNDATVLVDKIMYENKIKFHKSNKF